jgi:DDE superfamily endonuclease
VGSRGSVMSGSGHAPSATPTRSARKERRICRPIRALPRRSVVLARDETDLMMFPPLRAGRSLRGEPAKVHISGRNARRVTFGAMNLVTGTRLRLPRPKGRAGDFPAFLAQIRQHSWGRQVAPLLDEDPSHPAKGSLRAAEGMTSLGLPKRSPELNPMDPLWGQAKDVIAANKQDATIDEQIDRSLGFLDGLWGREALHTSGVLSDDFWLRATLSKKFCGLA